MSVEPITELQMQEVEQPKSKRFPNTETEGIKNENDIKVQMLVKKSIISKNALHKNLGIETEDWECDNYDPKGRCIPESARQDNEHTLNYKYVDEETRDTADQGCPELFAMIENNRIEKLKTIDDKAHRLLEEIEQDDNIFSHSSITNDDIQKVIGGQCEVVKMVPVQAFVGLKDEFSPSDINLNQKCCWLVLVRKEADVSHHKAVKGEIETEIIKQFVHELICVSQFFTAGYSTKDEVRIDRKCYGTQIEEEQYEITGKICSHYETETLHRAFYFEEEISSVKFQGLNQVKIDYNIHAQPPPRQLMLTSRLACCTKCLASCSKCYEKCCWAARCCGICDELCLKCMKIMWLCLTCKCCTCCSCHCECNCCEQKEGPATTSDVWSHKHSRKGKMRGVESLEVSKSTLDVDEFQIAEDYSIEANTKTTSCVVSYRSITFTVRDVIFSAETENYNSKTRTLQAVLGKGCSTNDALQFVHCCRDINRNLLLKQQGIKATANSMRGNKDIYIDTFKYGKKKKKSTFMSGTNSTTPGEESEIAKANAKTKAAANAALGGAKTVVKKVKGVKNWVKRKIGCGGNKDEEE